MSKNNSPLSPLIITCAITGAETSKEMQPALPITPEEQAQAAFEAVQAGASIIHLHVRTPDGKPTQSVSAFKESIDAIRSRVPDVIIQISTGGAIGDSIESRLKPLALRPEMASLNMGSVNFGEEVFINTPSMIRALAEAMKAHEVVPELEIYEAGMVESALRLHQQGILSDPLHFQFVLGVPGGMSGDIRNLLHLISLIPENATWGVAGIGRFQTPLAIHALTLGGMVRVGLEDNIYYHKGQLARSNAELVERVVRIAQELGRPVANCREARKILGI